MSRRNPWGEFFQNFDSAYNLGNKVGLQIGLRRAADVKPEAVTNTSLTDTTPNQEGMVYDADTGQYLPKYIGADGAPTEQAQAQLNTPADGASEAPAGMQPTFDAKTTTRHRMGTQEQDRPFTPEQVDAQRFRNQADVYTKFGMADKAAGLHGLAKGREEEGRTNAVRQSFIEGMAKNANLKPLERSFRATSVAADTALEQGNIAEWDKLVKMNEGIQSKLLSNHLDRADMITDPKARLVAYADAYKYVLDGRTTAGVTHNPDGTSTVKLSDGHEITAKSEDDIAKIGMFLRDPSMVRKLQQDAAIKARDRLAAREDKAWEIKAKDDSESGKADVAYKKAAADAHSANAEFTRGAKSDAARARASGGGNTVSQQRFDMQQASAFKKSVAPLISFENPVTQKMELNKHGDQLANMMIESGQFTPSEIRNKLYSISSKATTSDEFSKAAIEQMAKLNAALKASATPAESTRGVAEQPTPKPSVQPAAGMVKQPAPAPAEPSQPPAQQPKMIRRGQPYVRSISIPDGKGGWIQAPQEVEDVIDPGSGKIVTRPIARSLPRAMPFEMR